MKTEQLSVFHQTDLKEYITCKAINYVEPKPTTVTLTETVA